MLTFTLQQINLIFLGNINDMKILLISILLGLFPIQMLTIFCNAQYFISPSFGLNFTVQQVSQKTDDGKYITNPYSMSRNLAFHIGKRIGKWDIETGLDYSELMLYTQFYVKRPDICIKCDMGAYSGNGLVSWNVPIEVTRLQYYKRWQYGVHIGTNILNHNMAKPNLGGWQTDDFTFLLTKADNYTGLKISTLAGLNVGYMLSKHHQFNFQAFYNYGLSKIMKLDYRLDLHYNGVNKTYYYKTSYKGDYIGLRLSYRYLFNFK